MKRKLVTKCVCGLLAATMVFGTAGCGGSKDDAGVSAGSTETDGTAEETAADGTEHFKPRL